MKKNGFTLIEVLIVLAISVILLTLTVINITGFRAGQSLEDEAKDVVVLLQTAQAKAVSQEDNSRFGVYFDNTAAGPSYTLYRVDEAKVGVVDMPVVDEGSLQVRFLSTGVAFVHPASATSTNIMFTKSTGAPSTSTLIVLELSDDPTMQEIITVSATGLISR